MNIVLWICQIVLALAFAYSGIMKSSQNRERLVSMGQTGIEGLSYPLIRFIGITEMLGSIRIILPWAINILPVLTPVSALGFALIMVLAAPIHYKRKEYQSVGVNITFFTMSILVAFMRFIELNQR
jgi:uncharacterized membrane protein YphA (DoxX/SURF4 family)